MVEEIDVNDIFEEVVEKKLHGGIPFRCDCSFDERRA